MIVLIFICVRYNFLRNPCHNIQSMISRDEKFPFFAGIPVFMLLQGPFCESRKSGEKCEGVGKGVWVWNPG